VATLVVGQVLRRQPDRESFSCRTTCRTPCGLATDRQRVENLLGRAPVASKRRFDATVGIVKLFARQLADEADRFLIASNGGEPAWLNTVRQLVHSANAEGVTMRQAAQRAAMSPARFCKLFKKAAGMTFTEYVARVRVEKAKTLLRDPFARVAHVAFASGFGSIPQFNSVFRKLAGMSPSQFRATL
jgi:AraC-like DNA-binding protein